jgi:hypothetical protein
MAVRLTVADEFRAVAARYQKRANDTIRPAMRDAYRQLALGYLRLALQQEAIERCHAVVGRLDDDDLVDGQELRENLTVELTPRLTPRRHDRSIP